MVKESNRIRKEKSRAARSVLKREFDTERELFLHNKRRKARSPEKIILDKEKHRLYGKKDVWELRWGNFFFKRRLIICLRRKKKS